MQNSFTDHSTLEEELHGVAERVKRKVKGTYKKYEKIAQRSPGKTVLAAVASGYLLQRLPLRSLFVTNVRIAIALAPPVMLALGAAKLVGYLQRRPMIPPLKGTMLRHAGELRDDES